MDNRSWTHAYIPRSAFAAATIPSAYPKHYPHLAQSRVICDIVWQLVAIDFCGMMFATGGTQDDQDQYFIYQVAS